MNLARQTGEDLMKEVTAAEPSETTSFMEVDDDISADIDKYNK